jgi:hypothetical protein
MLMESNIKLLIGKSLSNEDILKLVNDKANLVSYTNIHKYKTLDQLLGKWGACVILYELKKLYGHWCCIFKLDNNTIEFFDPYSLMADRQLNFINKEYRLESNQNYPYLTRLMLDSPYVLTYNQYPFQEYKKGINSCGRWVAIRLLFRLMSLDQFIKLFGKKRRYKPDFYVTLLTNYI